MKSPHILGPRVGPLAVRPGFRVEFEPLVVDIEPQGPLPEEEPIIKQDALSRRIEALCKELGVDLALHSHLVPNLRRAVEGSLAPKGNKESLKKEIVEARAARDRFAPLEREVLRLIGGTSPHKVIHDLRNVLNDVGLLKVITDGSY